MSAELVPAQLTSILFQHTSHYLASVILAITLDYPGGANTSHYLRLHRERVDLGDFEPKASKGGLASIGGDLA